MHWSLVVGKAVAGTRHTGTAAERFPDLERRERGERAGPARPAPNTTKSTPPNEGDLGRNRDVTEKKERAP